MKKALQLRGMKMANLESARTSDAVRLPIGTGSTNKNVPYAICPFSYLFIRYRRHSQSLYINMNVPSSLTDSASKEVS